MLADAIRSEAYRLSKNRMTLIWSVLFVPVVAVIFATIGHVVLNAKASEIAATEGLPPEVATAMAGGPLNLAAAMAETAGDLANPAMLMFTLLAAAALFAGDYRWETWRLISARNGRVALILGKVATFAGLALIATLVMFIAGMIEDLIKAAVFERALTFDPTTQTTRELFAFWGLSWWRIVQFAMFALLAGVVTRSLLATLFIPLVLGIGQAVSPQMLIPMGFTPTDWPVILANPGMGYDILKAWAAGQSSMMAMSDGEPLKATVSLIGWTALPLLGALALFRRQDLSKE